MKVGVTASPKEKVPVTPKMATSFLMLPPMPVYHQPKLTAVQQLRIERTFGKHLPDVIVVNRESGKMTYLLDGKVCEVK